MERHGHQACCVLGRIARRILGVAVMVVLCGYLAKNYQDDIGTGYCKTITEEIQKLRAVCAARKAQGMKSSLKGEIEDGYSQEIGSQPKNMDDEIKLMVRRELEIYANDRTGMADFALENLGACVISTRDTKQLEVDTQNFLGIDFFRKYSDPNQMLRPTTVPGKCWAFSGSEGTAVIRLMAFVHISHISLDHMSPLLSPTGEISSAPKTFTLWGVNNVDELDSRHKFGTFTYTKEGPTVQTFPVQTPSSQSFPIIEVTFQENQGNPYFTCVYRVRIHGKLDETRNKREITETPQSDVHPNN